jgi:DNA polymerase
MDERKRLRYLQAMGIQPWAAQTSNKTPETITVAKTDRTAAISQMNWQQLETAVANCTACPLHKSRTRPVFGVGNQQADLLIVGEAPGAEEDRQGEPFVGRSGKLLNSMLRAIGLSREKIYIANVLKSRPPENRDPTAQEVAICTPFLQRQIVLLQPKIILALGRIAAHFLLGVDEAMKTLRGQEFHYGALNTPLIVTYHPAYLLRSPREKRKAWDDLQRVMKLLK